MLEHALKKNVKIAYENIRAVKNLTKIMERQPEAVFCWDTGHESCFSFGKRFMPLFGKRLAALHIHDNRKFPFFDDHRLPFDGKIDFDYTAREIAKTDYQGPLMLEVLAWKTKLYSALSPEEFRAQVQRIGLAVAGQTGHLAPADKKLYALRDVTATVDCLPLIASSVMSKKLAAGAKSIVLDVKAGKGAFMTDADSARELARRMVDIGTRCGRRMSALITGMDTPLGRAVGNAPEVAEAVNILQGGGDPELREVCLALSGEMLALSLHLTPEEGRLRAERALNSGAAMEKMLQWVCAQGGDGNALLCGGLPRAAHTHRVIAPQSGIVQTMDALLVGEAAGLLGTARFRAGDPVDPAAGLILLKKPGEPVAAGEAIAELYTNRCDSLTAAEARFRSAVTIGDEAPPHRPVIFDVVRGDR